MILQYSSKISILLRPLSILYMLDIIKVVEVSWYLYLNYRHSYCNNYCNNKNLNIQTIFWKHNAY